MNPQTLHDAWLVITAITMVLLIGAAVYLWKGYRRRFFWMTALLLFLVVLDQFGAEVKNYTYPTPASASMRIVGFWLTTRILLMCGAAFVLGYYMFGRNGVGQKTES